MLSVAGLSKVPPLVGGSSDDFVATKSKQVLFVSRPKNCSSNIQIFYHFG